MGEGTFVQNVLGKFLDVGTSGESELPHNSRKWKQQAYGFYFLVVRNIFGMLVHALLCKGVHPFQENFIMLCKPRFDVTEGFQHKMVG